MGRQAGRQGCSEGCGTKGFGDEQGQGMSLENWPVGKSSVSVGFVLI